MNWEDIKEHIYYKDGSLRDIYIRNINADDWKSWIDFVNNNYRVDFQIGNMPKVNAIDFEIIKEFWNDSEKECPSATIYLENIKVKTYFFSESEIENDITPNEIVNFKDHEKIVEYLMQISNL